MTTQDVAPYVTVDEYARHVAMSREWVTKQCQRGLIAGAIRCGRAWRIPRRSLPGWTPDELRPVNDEAATLRAELERIRGEIEGLLR